jgi:hypothetical protein
LVAARERRFPTLDEIRAKAERGVVDDSLATEAALDLEDWEIRGKPPPDERPAPERRASA